MEQTSIRAFTAVYLNDALNDTLTRFSEKLKEKCPYFKTSSIPERHVTMHFFKGLKLCDYQQLVIATQEILTSVRAFPMALSGVSVFSVNGKPRILWAALGVGSRSLKQLKSQLDARYLEIGLDFEKRAFTPHITLGRISKRLRTQAVEDLICFDDQDLKGKMMVENMSLMKSTLTNHGPEHSTLARFDLRARAKGDG